MTGRSSLFSIAIAVTALPLLYLLGFGPACWLTHRLDAGEDCFRLVYWPIGRLAEEGPAR